MVTRMKEFRQPAASAQGEEADAKNGAVPIHEQLKAYVRQCIKTGEWKPGDLISSEHALARQFGVARMTVARAFRDLANAGVLTRVQGTGTFVSTPRHESTIAEIRSIDEDVTQRGRRYTAKVLSLDSSTDQSALTALQRASGFVYHSRIVHCEDDVPIQYEDRYVNPQHFPQYLSQNFTQQTPGSYMLHIAPFQQIEYRISAQLPNAPMRRRLMMEPGEPCLVHWQRAWIDGQIASVVHFWHPAARFEFSGRAAYR